LTAHLSRAAVKAGKFEAGYENTLVQLQPDGCAGKSLTTSARAALCSRLKGRKAKKAPSGRGMLNASGARC
jgi:hypothetical protein